MLMENDQLEILFSKYEDEIYNYYKNKDNYRKNSKNFINNLIISDSLINYFYPNAKNKLSNIDYIIFDLSILNINGNILVARDYKRSLLDFILNIINKLN